MTGFTTAQIERPVNAMLHMIELQPEFVDFINALCSDGETVKEAIWRAKSL